MLVKDSGFEDIVFQSGVCTSGSLQGVLLGSHYNRGWTVHNAVSEALERLLLQRFLYDENIDLPSVDASEEMRNFVARYERFQVNIRNGNKGKTAQFWMFYLDLIRAQLIAHTSAQENNIDMLIAAWNKFLPMYFALNKINYARYESFYLHTLINMENMYPGLRNLLNDCGISVQGQESYPLRIAVDQRGEQTINCDAKTSGE